MNNSPGVTIGPSVCFKVQKIIGVSVGEGNMRNYQVQWAPSWVSSLHLVGCEHLIEEYVHQQPESVGKSNPTFATHENTTHHRHHNTVDSLHRRSYIHPENFIQNAHTTYSHRKDLTTHSETERNGPYVHNDAATNPNFEWMGVGSHSNNSKSSTASFKKPTEEIIAKSGNASTNRNFEWLGGSGHLNSSKSSTPLMNAPIEESISKSNNNQNSNTEFFSKMYQTDENHGQTMSRENNFEEVEDEDIIVILPGDLEQHTFTDDRSSMVGQSLAGENSLAAPTDKLECTICHRKLKNMSGFTQHLNKAHGVATFKCNMCNEKFESEGALRKHELSIHGMFEEIKCKTCDAVFDEQSELRAHNAHVHKKPTPVGKNKCPVCDKLCISKSKLERHMRVHTGERPFKCKVCRRGFKRKDDLKKHVITHESANISQYIAQNMEEENPVDDNMPKEPDGDVTMSDGAKDDVNVTEEGSSFCTNSMEDHRNTPEVLESGKLVEETNDVKNVIVDAGKEGASTHTKNAKTNPVVHDGDQNATQDATEVVTVKEEDVT